MSASAAATLSAFASTILPYLSALVLDFPLCKSGGSTKCIKSINCGLILGGSVLHAAEAAIDDVTDASAALLFDILNGRKVAQKFQGMECSIQFTIELFQPSPSHVRMNG
jgi:hypothetical protein